MTSNIELIVLHTTKLSDSSVVIHTLSREYGRRGFMVRGLGSGKKGHGSMSLFLPMNIIEADITPNSKSSLYTARNICPAVPLMSIRSNIYKNSICLFLSEVLFKALRDGSNEDGLYDWCKKEIQLLDALESDWNNFHLKFLSDLMSQLGFTPEAVDMLPFAQEQFDTVMKLIRSSFSEAMLIPLNGVQRNKLAASMLHYIEYHIEATLNINSLEVLREIFS